MVVLYYLIVGILEEVSKHFSFLGSSFIDMDSVKKWALLSVFIALGFGFVENILYLSTILSSKGLGSDLITTWIFRSIFSVFVHIFCGMIVASAFWRANLNPINTWKIGRYMKVFLLGIIASIAIHAIYDVGLTFGFTAIIFIYLIVGYLYCTGVFHRDAPDILPR
jgi:RsiW-degrading membrane proteinase PrsW (M82 family)